MTCRYAAAGCTAPVTYICQECRLNVSGLNMSPYYCEEHAMRHDNLVRKMGGSIFAERLAELQQGASQ